MTLLMINKEDLYHFDTVEDAMFWLQRNPTDKEQIILVDEDEDDDLCYFLDEHYPIEIL